jgi:predicted signal transduction protein with EAL and GGDEF domain
VAEGIEDAGTLVALRELGCDLAQGYHISRPLTAGGFAAWLGADDRRTAQLGVADLDRDLDARRRAGAHQGMPTEQSC